MKENPERVLIKVDLNGKSVEADCLDCLVAFPIAIERMRADADDFYIPDAMIGHTRDAFSTVDARGGDGIRLVAIATQDLLYQQIAQLTILDRYTRTYVAQAIQYLFTQLSGHGICTFFILDNSLRDDQFAAVLELFDLAGVVVVTPRLDGKEWQNLSARIRTMLAAKGHVAYVEPDAEVNHLDSARRLAKESSCVATFRNLAPEDPRFEVLALYVPSH